MGFVESLRFLEITCDSNKVQAGLLRVPERMRECLSFLTSNLSAGLESLGMVLSRPAMPVFESQQREHSARMRKQFSGGGAGIVKNFR